MAAQTGRWGGSSEDATNDPQPPIDDFGLAGERVRAGVESARSLPFPFAFAARAENYLHGRPDLQDTIRRLQAFQDAGADVLYAPGLTKPEDIAAVVGSVDRPVNVLSGIAGITLSAEELSRLGVKRISTGSALNRAALGAFLGSCTEMQQHGNLGYARQAAGFQDITAMLKAQE